MSVFTICRSKTPGREKATMTLEDLRSKLRNADLNTIFIFGAIALVLGIGLCALFSPPAQSQAPGNPACGKIVVAADGPSLNANVSPTLAGAAYFLVIDPLTQEILEAVNNPYAGTQAPDVSGVRT